MDDDAQPYEAPSAEDYYSDNTQGRKENRYALSQIKQGRPVSKKQGSFRGMVQAAKNFSKTELNAHLHRLGLPDDDPDMMPVVRDGMFVRIGELLRMFRKVEWSLRPRTFCILHVLGCQELMDSFVELKKTDASLPYSPGNLPKSIKGERRSRFLKLQEFVLSDPDRGYLEREGGDHLNFSYVPDNHFSHMRLLGQGGTGVVDDVFGLLTTKRFARKRIHRGNSALADQKALDIFLNELAILKKASHRHLVKLVSSYTDPTYVTIIMQPVADEHLKDYLQRPFKQSTDVNVRKQCIRTFYGCLTNALEYLHMKGIQHKDIKPHNILVKRDEVYLTDFGTAKAHGESSRSNSTGPVRAYTPKYAAPEIVVYDPHGKPSDIWSMGCVFLEMATILHDRTLESMDKFYLEHGTKYGPYYLNEAATAEWIEELRQVSQVADSEPLTWIQEMLQVQPASRPTVSQVLASISDAQSEHRFFCFACTQPTHEGIPQRTSETLTSEVLKDVMKDDHGHNHSSDDSDETVTAQILEEVGVVPCETNGDAPPLDTENEGHFADKPFDTGNANVATGMESATQVCPTKDTESKEISDSNDIAAVSAKSDSASEAKEDMVKKSTKPIRSVLKDSPHVKEDADRNAKQVTFTAASSSEPPKEQHNHFTQKGRFTGLHSDHRPEPTEPDFEKIDIDNQPIIAPEPLQPPPIQLRDCYPLPNASFVPSYILAGSNRFSMNEVRSIDPTLGRFNLFVYGRLMFPSTVRGFAAHSINGVYSPMHQRRLALSSQDWARANMSIKHAAEIMTPAVLQGFDVWRPTGCEFAAIQDSSSTGAILANRDLKGLRMITEGISGKVTGFVLMGLTEEALRYCDLVFSSDRENLRHGKLPSTNEKDDKKKSIPTMIGKPLFERQRVTVDIQLTNGQIRSVAALTYIWKDGLGKLWHPWRPESFVRGPGFSQLSSLESQAWVQEEAALAQTMKLNYALVGDEVCATVLSGDTTRLEELLYDQADINGNCRKYGTPLQAAVVKGNEEMVKFLLEAGADPSKPGGTYGTPLIAAAIGSKKFITRILLKHRADVFTADKQHVNALYQAVGHGDWAITEMLLEAGAWLLENYSEIKDLAFERRNQDIQSLLSEYDVQDARMTAIEASKSSNQIDDGRPRNNRALLQSSSHVLKMVFKKVAFLSTEQGSWRGRKGLAVARVALAAGASPSILNHIRNAIDPVSKLVDALKEADKRREAAQSEDDYESGRVEELASDAEDLDVEQQTPLIQTIRSQESESPSPGRSTSRIPWSRSSSTSRSPLARSPIDPVEMSREHSPAQKSSTPTRSPSRLDFPDFNRNMPPADRSPKRKISDAHRADVPIISVPQPRHYSNSNSTSKEAPKQMSSRDHTGYGSSPQTACPPSPQFLEIPSTSRARARSLDIPQTSQYIYGQHYVATPSHSFSQRPNESYSPQAPPSRFVERALPRNSEFDQRRYSVPTRIIPSPTSAKVPLRSQDADARGHDSRRNSPSSYEYRRRSDTPRYRPCSKCNGIGRYREIWTDRNNQRHANEVPCEVCADCR